MKMISELLLNKKLDSTLYIFFNRTDFMQQLVDADKSDKQRTFDWPER